VSEDPLDPRAATEDPLGPEGDDESFGALEVAPVVARLAAGAAWRGAGWTVGAYVRGMNWLTRAALSDESTAELLNEARAGIRHQARSLLGFDEIEERVYGGGGRNGDAAEPDSPPPDPLRERGHDLLARSADVDLDRDAHPAYERILDQLAPDEARVLRLLATEGARPSVDVRTWRPLGVGSQIVAPGLSMIGAEAGCKQVERVPAYLNNLFRLGLIWFSREPLDDLNLYQVLEVQPDVIEAMKRAGRGSTVRRSIHLTPFGVDFCETCIPLSAVE
jgi:hypothetical protein